MPFTSPLTSFDLGLAVVAGVRVLDADDAGEPLAHVFALEQALLQLLEQVVLRPP
jgi:hypothetical protein